MKEDESFNSRIRAAMEDGVAVSPQRLGVIVFAAEREAQRRRAWRLVRHWVPVSLLAASVAIAAVVGTMVWGGGGASATGVVDAIDLLCELDGVPDEEMVASTPGELLLAWQEEPCAGNQQAIPF